MEFTVAVTTGAVLCCTLALLYLRHYKNHIASRRYCKSNVKLDGKTVIITGANSGIGKQTALDLARRGARVILACRSLQKAEDAAEEIRTRTGNSEVVVRRLDLGSLQSVREFARQINEEEKRLDILINNAGVPFAKAGAATPENFHLVFGTNHFGHFLLTNLLLDLLKKTALSRVITVSSKGHCHESTLDLRRQVDAGAGKNDDGTSQILYPHLESYHQSKLANILFSRELSRRLESTGVTSVSLHPGVIYSPIWRNIGVNWALTLCYYICLPLIRLLFIDEVAGAQTTLYCALDESVPKFPGGYFANCAALLPTEAAQNDELARRLWEISCQATGLA